MNSEHLIARSISACEISGLGNRTWQYHSRSDRHSKIACWAILFDLLRSCSLLRKHASAGKVRFGINHEMHDFRLNRKKNLDLVLCWTGGPLGDGLTFSKYGEEIGVVLSDEEEVALAELPVLAQGPVTTVMVALEAKACMTAHIRARPRLYDELSSSFQTIHGDTANALAAAFVMINTASDFLSPGKNSAEGALPAVNRHHQPKDTLAVLAKVMELARRSDEHGVGFDAIGVSMVSCRNDGSPVLVDSVLGAKIDPVVRYEMLIQRISQLYGTRFAAM